MPNPISFMDWIESLRMKRDDKKQDDIKKGVPSQQQNDAETSSAKEKQAGSSGEATPSSRPGAAMSADILQPSDGVSAGVAEKMGVDNSPVRVFSMRVLAMGLIVSIGGLIVCSARE